MENSINLLSNQNLLSTSKPASQSSNITNLDIADGIVACKFKKPCEVEIIKLGLRSTTSQLYSEIPSRK
jgi:hypothetical protein